MKKIISFAVISIMAVSAFATPSAKSFFFADSYMLRANGVEANYWNPAKLSADNDSDFWLPLGNSGVQISNNALDLDTYNFFVSADTLNAEGKERILKDMDGSIDFNSTANISLIGVTMGNTAISASGHFHGKGMLSEDFLRLALYGNTEEEYRFNKDTNNASALSYIDVTYGIGDIIVPYIPENIPQIKAGFAASLLTGIACVETHKFDVLFRSTEDEGASLDSDIELRTGVLGAGFKGMLGLYSEITPWLETGITVDNIAGFIKWGLSKDIIHYYASADSVYISNADTDIFTQGNERYKSGAFTTNLGTEMRLAALVKHKYATLSADWVQGFSNTVNSSKVGRLSFGAGFMPTPFLPLSLGISLPNSSNPLKVSYGLGLKSKSSEISLAIQSYDSLFPGYKSKGISFGTALRIWF